MTVMTSPCLSVTSELRVRQLVDQLIEAGENQTLLDDVPGAEEEEHQHHLAEFVYGWGPPSLPPRPHQVKKATQPRRSQRQAQSDINTANMVVRCLQEDFNPDHHKIAWKANVEPGTYRYICNNGIYRSTKFAKQDSEWVTAKRSRFASERHVSLNPEVRQAQRSLKKDLSQHFQRMHTEHLKLQTEASPPQGSRSPVSSRVDGKLPYAESPLALGNSAAFCREPSSDKTNGISVASCLTPPSGRTHGTLAPSYPEPPSSRTLEISAQSLEPPSARYLGNTAPQPSRNSASHAITYAEYSRSNNNLKISKSASDLFLENFSTRMTAIENEEKGQAGRRSQSPEPKSGLSSVQAPLGGKKSVEAVTTSEPGRFLVKQVEDISKDVFLVRPVVRAEQPLRPLEKLTAQQRNQERNGSASEKLNMSSSNTTSPDRESLVSTSFMTAMDVFNQSNQPNVR